MYCNKVNRRKCNLVIGILFMVIVVISPILSNTAGAASKESSSSKSTGKSTSKKNTSKKKHYTISTKSKPFDKRIMKYSTYNKYTKDYYLLLSYLMEFEKQGGGTLTLKKGTYTISNTLYVPSNVTIILSDGVVIKKGTKTGTKKFPASKTIFQFIKQTKSTTKKAYGKYDNAKNINVIGKGTAVIDLCYVRDSIAIVAGHNKNILVNNITFRNMNSGHFMEVTAVSNMTIKNNKFLNSKPSAKLNKEAINIDTPDKETKGFNNIWSKHDKTPNKNIKITNNYFYNLDRAIGTHKYSQKKDKNGKYTINMYHSEIIIKYNEINKMRSDGIRVLNWKNSVIQDNVIKNIARNKKNYRGILASGALNLTIKSNQFTNMARPIQIFPAKNTGPGGLYSVTYNKITEQNKKDMRSNKLKDVEEDFVRISSKYNNFTNPEKISLKVSGKK